MLSFISPRRLWEACALLSMGASVMAAEPQAKNIVFILIDDLGFADTAPYGGKFVDTPNFDRMAREGTRFTQAYAPAPICSASRASILTGRTPARMHVEFVVQPRTAKPPSNTLLRQPPYPLNLPLEACTMGEVFSQAGLSTGYFGKWHLSEHQVPENPQYLGYGPTYGPAAHQFKEVDEDRGSHPYGYGKDKKKRAGFGDFTDGQYEPDSLVDKALDFMARHKDERFFLFLGQYYVHTPVNTRCQWLFEKYRVRAQERGLPYDAEAIKYAAFVETMDYLVGLVLDQIDKLGLADDTLVLLTNDNGGMPLYADNGPLRGSKWTLYEGGIRVPMLARWPDRVKAGGVCDVPVSGTDLLPTFCDAFGIKTPETACDGRSFYPVLLGRSQTVAGREPFIWHFPFYHQQYVGTRPCSAIRKGDMKLLYFYEDDRVELYDLKENPGESKDISLQNRMQAGEMKDELLERLRAQGARFPEEVAPHAPPNATEMPPSSR